MAKPEIEFSDMATVPWTPVQAGSGVVGEGISEKVLSRDESGNTTRLLRLEPGVESDEVITHDFWEEVIIQLDQRVKLAALDPKATVFWVKPEVGCEVDYAEAEASGLLREPILKSW